MNRNRYSSKPYLIRYGIVLLSMFMVGLGMSIMRIACLGTEPFSCMAYSLSEHFHISLGLVMAGINGALLVLTFLFLREALGFGTIVNLFLLGTAGEFWGNLIRTLAGHEVVFTGMEQLVLRLVLLCIGMVTMVFSCSFYIACEMGMGAYDSLGYIIERVTKRIPFQWARVGIDSTCVLLGWYFASLEGTQWQLIGIGTIVMAFGIGPLLTFFIKHVSGPIVRKVAAGG